MKRSLKLGAAVVVLLWTGLVVWIGMDLLAARQREFDSTELVGATLAKALDRNLTTTVQKIDLQLVEFMHHYRHDILVRVPRAQLEAELSRFLALFPEAQSFRITDAQGNYIYDASGEVSAVNIADRPYFQSLKAQTQDALVVSEPLVSRINQKPVFVLARRLVDADGKFAGVVLAAVKVSYFEELFSTLSVGEHGIIAMHTDRMQLIGRYPPIEAQRGKVIADSPIPAMLAQGQPSGSFRRRGALDQQERLFVYRKPDHLPFVISIGFAESDILQEWYRRVLIYGVLLTLLTLVLLAFYRAWAGSYRNAEALAHRMTTAYRDKESQSQALLNAIPAVAWLIDTHGHYLALNQHFSQVAGRPIDQLLGKLAEEVFPPAVAETLRIGRERTFAQGTYREETWMDLGHGPQLFRFDRVLMRDVTGQTTGMAGVAWDITQQYKDQERQRVVAHVIDHSAEGLLILDPSFHITACNETFTQLTGFTLEGILHADVRRLSTPREQMDDLGVVQASLQQHGVWSGETWLRHKDGHDMPVWCNVGQVLDDQQHLVNIVVLLSDLSTLKANEARLEALTTVDQMSGLPNRFGFAKTFSEWLGQGKRGALLVLDMDQLARVNDAFGHEAGDLLLIQVSQRLSHAINDRGLLGRIGGDQFGLLIEGMTDPEDMEQLARQLLQSVAEPILIQQRDIVTTASIGICRFPEDGDNAVALLRHADAAMHQAKNDGMGLYRFFSHEMNVQVAERLQLESDLRHALTRNELELHYQPQINITNQQIVGFECLLRWRHPQQGLVSPLTFIPIAEETKLILPIGAWVLEEACRHNKAWQDAGFPPAVVAVNISAIQFHDQTLVQQVARTLEKTGLAPCWLELEITESSLMSEPEKVVAVLKELKALGIQLAIDDFGTGYSSLAYLKRFPIDKIKIDRSFVQDIHTDANDAAIVRMVIAMANQLERKVIAEGVETAEQLAFLQDHQCDEIQGYLFSRPLPQGQVADYISKHRPLAIGSNTL